MVEVHLASATERLLTLAIPSEDARRMKQRIYHRIPIYLTKDIVKRSCGSEYAETIFQPYSCRPSHRTGIQGQNATSVVLRWHIIAEAGNLV